MNFVHTFTKAGDVRFYSEKEIRALAGAAGLEVSRWRKLNWLNYLLAAGKKS